MARFLEFQTDLRQEKEMLSTGKRRRNSKTKQLDKEKVALLFDSKPKGSKALKEVLTDLNAELNEASRFRASIGTLRLTKLQPIGSQNSVATTSNLLLVSRVEGSLLKLTLDCLPIIKTSTTLTRLPLIATLSEVNCGYRKTKRLKSQ